jgi:hypothetical protein
MSTWSYVVPLGAEHAKYLKSAGVVAPTLAKTNRAPDEADVAAATAELGAVDKAALTIDCYRADGDPELTVAIRGRTERVLAFLLALTKRCGQLYLFPFPFDSVPGVVADPADDMAGVLGRMDPETREAVDAAMRAGR